MEKEDQIQVQKKSKVEQSGTKWSKVVEEEPRFEEDDVGSANHNSVNEEWSSGYNYQPESGEPTDDALQNEKAKRREANLEARRRYEELLKKGGECLTTEEREYLDKKRKKKEKQMIKNLKKANESVIEISGLPTDITESEILAFVQKKAGRVKRKTTNNKPMIKFLPLQSTEKNDNDQPQASVDSSSPPQNSPPRQARKAKVTFLNPSSVALALDLLDEEQIKPNFRVHIRKAPFVLDRQKLQKAIDAPPEQLGLGPSKKKNRFHKANQVDWKDNEECRVVLKNVFSTEPMPDDSFFEELQEAILEEAQTMGEVERVKIFERNPLGIIVIKFKSFFVAERAVEKFNGRWFDKRRLEAELYDGFSNFQVEESKEQEEERVKKWHDYLQNQDDEEEEE